MTNKHKTFGGRRKTRSRKSRLRKGSRQVRKISSLRSKTRKRGKNRKRSVKKRQTKKKQLRSRTKKRNYSKSHPKKDKCYKYLKSKIKINMSEYKRGRYSSRQQALAVSYSQTKKKYPGCSRYFKRI